MSQELARFIYLLGAIVSVTSVSAIFIGAGFLRYFRESALSLRESMIEERKERQRFLNSMLEVMHEERRSWQDHTRILQDLILAQNANRRWDERGWQFSPLAIEMDRTLQRHEQELGIRLTPGARQMLLIPIVEANEQGLLPDPQTVDRSIITVLSTVRENDTPELRGRVERPSSISVIRAFWKNFCNIPPFCSVRERTQTDL